MTMAVEHTPEEPDAAPQTRADALDLWLLAGDGADIGVWAFDPLTGDFTCDAHCAALLGGAGAPVTLAQMADRLHPEDRAWIGEALTHAAAGAVPAPLTLDVECRLRPAATGDRWIVLRGGRVGAPTGARLCGVAADITARKALARAQALLVGELHHRVKNTLATVQAIASRTLRGAGSLEEARTALTSRLVTLGKAHDVLTEENWEGAEMGAVARRALAPFRETSGDRFDIGGPFVRISPPKAMALFMALHELSTNAVKYGALSSESGRVALTWEVYADAQSRRLRIVWRESGGPPASPPARTGFGAQLLRQGLTGQFGAEVEMDFRPQGLWCTIDAPLLHIDRKTPQ